MARAKTGSFYLTETVELASTMTTGQRNSGSLDLGAYVSVSQGIAIAVESVDFVWQAGTDFSQAGQDFLSADGGLSVQLTDLNPGDVFVRADDQSLIASGSMNIDNDNNIVTHIADLYPDNFGPSNLSEAFLVVNDTLHMVAGPNSADIGTVNVFVTARIKCRIVSLSKSDWIAIAIQSTASDN